jgi:hypothetical protein
MTITSTPIVHLKKNVTNMKHIMDWKLSQNDLNKMVVALHDVIDTVVSRSAPYKQLVKFVKAYSEGACIEINGEQFFINQRFCYFTPGLPSKGDEVYVDNRYIH